MRHTLRIALFAAPYIFILSTGAPAEEFVKWTDENGQIHYADNPADVPAGKATAESKDFSVIPYTITSGSGTLTSIYSEEESPLNAPSEYYGNTNQSAGAGAHTGQNDKKDSANKVRVTPKGTVIKDGKIAGRIVNNHFISREQEKRLIDKKLKEDEKKKNK